MNISRITQGLIPVLANTRARSPTYTVGLQAIQKTPNFSQYTSFRLMSKKIDSSSQGLKKENQAIGEKLESIIQERYSIHPFAKGVSHENAQVVLRHYYAMSQAFPYLQAGAYKDLILNCINKNIGMSRETEETFVVGAFLSFDETGGNWLLRTEGISALPKVLNTKENFHASLLEKDLITLFGKKQNADFSGPTGLYLKTLLKDLGNKNHVSRCAAMVAFELHAGNMIEALWSSVSQLHPEIPKESLKYFETHVGGDDPQEEYHKQLTKKMTESLVPKDKTTLFLKEFIRCYELNLNWCNDICKL